MFPSPSTIVMYSKPGFATACEKKHKNISAAAQIDWMLEIIYRKNRTCGTKQGVLHMRLFSFSAGK